VLHDQEARQVAGERNQPLGVITLVLSALVTLYGVARIAEAGSASTTTVGGFVDAVIPLIAGFGGVLAAIFALARKRATWRHFGATVGVLVLVAITVGTLRSLIPGTQVAMLDRREALERMKEQAEELCRAVRDNDHAKVADHTHPKVVAQAGGRERMIQALELNAEQMKSRGSSIRSVEIGIPTGLVEQDGERVGIIPFTLELEAAGRRGSQGSFLVGVSSDGGRTWSFVDGSQAGSGKLKRLFPNLPDTLQLPPVPALREAED
jgi:hypothetical protein